MIVPARSVRIFREHLQQKSLLAVPAVTQLDGDRIDASRKKGRYVVSLVIETLGIVRIGGREISVADLFPVDVQLVIADAQQIDACARNFLFFHAEILAHDRGRIREHRVGARPAPRPVAVFQQRGLKGAGGFRFFPAAPCLHGDRAQSGTLQGFPRVYDVDALGGSDLARIPKRFPAGCHDDAVRRLLFVRIRGKRPQEAGTCRPDAQRVHAVFRFQFFDLKHSFIPLLLPVLLRRSSASGTRRRELRKDRHTSCHPHLYVREQAGRRRSKPKW